MFKLTGDQEKTLKKIIMFFDFKKKQFPAPVYKIAGYAGTGKTTLASFFTKELNIENDTMYLAYTGKAVQVLNRKKIMNVLTIHSFAYKLVSSKLITEDGKVKRILKFRKKTLIEIEREFPDIKLLVIDEASMVDNSTTADLRSFGIPIIALGDPMQLPPIHGTSDLLLNPDSMLTQITRNALDSAIIRLSMDVRNGKNIKNGSYGNDVMILNERHLKDDTFLNADQIICGKNDTRREINNYVRHDLLQFDRDIPIVEREKLICLKNYWKTHLLPTGLEGTNNVDYYLTNGTIGYAMQPTITKKVVMGDNDTIISKEHGDFYFEADFLEDMVGNDEMYKRAMLDPTALEPDFLNSTTFFPRVQAEMKSLINGEKSLSFDKFNRSTLKLFNYAYAITAHLSQGSEWDKVLIFEERFGNREFHTKWLYTAITRSISKCILARN